MGLFGQYANVYKSVQETIISRTRTVTTKGTNGELLANIELVSALKPWIRISSAVNKGLVIGTDTSLDPLLGNLYGTNITAGKIGNDFDGNPILEKSTVKARGYRPSPIIESIGIENGSEGLTRKLTFQIKCFSLPQLDTITQYFLEPRFYLLAEWGWNTTQAYAQLANVNSGLDTAVCDMIAYMNLKTLKDKRSGSGGHYDAFLGVITGGSMDFGEDETYIVNVEVTTAGEIPAYLQQNKGSVETINASDGTVNKSSIAFNIASDIKTAEDSADFGTALFMYMFNDLPAQKQIKEIKDLQNQTITEVSKQHFVDQEKLATIPDMKYWCEPWQYINMNTTLIDKLRDGLTQGAEIGLRDTTVEYNGEQPLVSDSRYIRMELAWKILNEIGKNDIIQDAFSCNGKSVNVPNHTISIDTTVCRAHKHMFSTNRNFLVIPNKYCPDFGLETILRNASSATSGSDGFLNVEAGVIKTKDITMYNLPGSYKFPRLNTFKEAVSNGLTMAEEYDDSYRLINKPANSWGMLKDLYINFDFFCECLNRNGALIKDIAIDILNGLSQAVNMFWDFQIVEIGSTNKNDRGLQKLVVVDANFTGIPDGGKLTNGTDTAQHTLSLSTIGINSPFLEINMTIKITGALGNQVMAQRNDILNSESGKSSATIEDKVEDFTGLFANGAIDHLTNKINEIQSRREGAPEPGSTESDRPIFVRLDTSFDPPQAIYKYKDVEYPPINYYDEYRNVIYVQTSLERINQIQATELAAEAAATEQSNWIMFIQKATVVSKNNNPELDDFDTSAFFNLKYNDADFYELRVVCWEDSQLLRQVYEYDMKSGSDRRFEAKTNPGFLPIEVEFTIHGVSGLKVGDMINFNDLPHVYRKKIFTVQNIKQILDGDMWKTIVTTACRPLELKQTFAIAGSYTEPLPGADPNDITGGRGVPYITRPNPELGGGLPGLPGYDPSDPLGLRRRLGGTVGGVGGD
jgi:hypothetical protein